MKKANAMPAEVHARYIQSNMEKCPYCEDPEYYSLSTWDEEYKGQEFTAHIRCRVCNHSWEEVYLLNRIVEVSYD